MWRVTAVPGKEPSDWPVEKFVDIGTSEEFVQQLILEAGELIGGTVIPEPRRGEAKHLIIRISVEGLMPAFQHLRRIRASVGKQIPILDRQQLYDDFATNLWRSYKDLTQRAVKEMGFDIGFLFRNDKDFRKGLAKFEAEHANIGPAFGVFLEKQRDTWQNSLAHFRDEFVEHRQDERSKFADFYKPETADRLFEFVWKTIADILFTFVAATLPPAFGLREIPPAERSGEPPRRFQIVLLWPLPEGK